MLNAEFFQCMPESVTKIEHLAKTCLVRVSEEGFDEQMIAYFKEKGTILQEYCRQCVKYPSCTFLKACPNGEECYPEMPAMYQAELEQEAKELYKDFLKREKEAAEKKAKEAAESAADDKEQAADAPKSEERREA